MEFMSTCKYAQMTYVYMTRKNVCTQFTVSFMTILLGLPKEVKN